MSNQNLSPSDYIRDTSREFSMYVCENRAIPKVSDGLKDSQRKALWLMRKKTDKIKVVALGGEMMSSNLYVHGDASANDAISKLGAPYLNNVPYIKGVGAFGTRVSPVEGIGAPRYISVKRTKTTDLLVYPDLDVVPMVENYDGSVMQPDTFLPIIPLVLLNGISGIAVGWATEILPRSMPDIIRATLAAIEGKRFNKLIPTYSYLNTNVKHIEANSWEFFGSLDIVDASTVRVTELPPDLTLDKFKARLVTFEDEGKIRDWTDSSTKTINIEVKFKRGYIKGWSEEKLINHLKLKSKKSERIVVLDWDGQAIRQYDSAEQLVKDFVDWRFGHYIKRYEKLLADTEYELTYWKAIKMCFDADLPSKLVKMKDKKAIETEVVKITSTLNLVDEQIEKIVSVATYNWAKDRYKYVLEKIKELTADRKEYTSLLKTPSKIKAIFKDEVEALKKEKFV